MSEDPRVELIREGFEAWEAGDAERTMAMYDPEVVVYAPAGDRQLGHLPRRRWLRPVVQAWFEAWETFDQDLLSIEPIGERHAISQVMQHGVGKGSGVKVDRPATWVYEMRDEKLIYMALFFDHDAAMAHVHEREGGASG